MLHEAITSSRGDKRGAPFARGAINLAKYAGATVGKRVVLALVPEGKALSGDDKETAARITAVVTVAAEPADKTPTSSSAALDEMGAAAERSKGAMHRMCLCVSRNECIACRRLHLNLRRVSFRHQSRRA